MIGFGCFLRWGRFISSSEFLSFNSCLWPHFALCSSRVVVFQIREIYFFGFASFPRACGELVNAVTTSSFHSCHGSGVVWLVLLGGIRDSINILDFFQGFGEHGSDSCLTFGRFPRIHGRIDSNGIVPFVIRLTYCTIRDQLEGAYLFAV